jgi:SAM-dependent methyltransferase
VTSGQPADRAAAALSLRLFQAMLAAQESFAAYLGVKLGLYEALAGAAPATVAQLAARTGVAARYAREWLEQQAVAGLLGVDDAALPWHARVYHMPPGHERVLTASADPLSLVSTAMLPVGSVAAALPALLDAYRAGTGVPAGVFGDDWRAGHGGANRAAYTHNLAGWLRTHVPDVVRRLATRPCRLADIGCGAGWASIALAAAYPMAEVTGVDADADTLGMAEDNAKEAGCAHRVRFVHADVAGWRDPDGFDLVGVFDTLHELTRPVPALRACRALRAADGAVLVLDARTADRFAAPGDEIERFQYATSVLHCLPASLVEDGAPAIGTVLRAPQVREFARQAGFGRVSAYDLTDRFHRLYRLDD